MHPQVKITLSHRKVKLPFPVKTDLIVKGINDQHIEHQKIFLIPLLFFVKGSPQLPVGLPIIRSQAVSGIFTAVMGVAKPPGLGEAEAVDQTFHLPEDLILLHPFQNAEKAGQPGVCIIKQYLVHRNVESHVAAAAEQIHHLLHLLGKQGEKLGQKLEFSPRIVERRWNQLLWPFTALAEKQPLFIFLDIRLSGGKGLVAFGVNRHLPLLSQNPQDVFVADLRVGALISLAGHVVVGQKNVFRLNMVHQILKGLDGLGGAVVAL